MMFITYLDYTILGDIKMILGKKIKYNKFQKRNKLKKTDLLSKCESDCFYGCSNCYDDFYDDFYDGDLSIEEYEEFDEYLKKEKFYCLNNKEIKAILKEDFLNSVNTNKIFNNDFFDKIFIDIEESDLKEGVVKDYFFNFINENKYKLKIKLIVKFKDYMFNVVESVGFRIYNIFKEEDDFLNSILTGGGNLKKSKNYIDIEIFKYKKEIKFYNHKSIRTLLEESNAIKRNFEFPEYCETNEDKIFYFFAKDYHIFKNKIFDLKDVIKSENSRKLLDIYLF